MDNRPALLLFTKKPVPGQVKTRLLPNVSAATAADIALEMMVDTVEKTTACWPGKISLLVSPDTHHPQLRELADRGDLSLGIQSKGDLGVKMESAIRDALALSPAAAVMGCDVPSVSPMILQLAYERMLEGDNVMGPSIDGGFYFAGFQQYRRGMFKDIEWGTPAVFETVLARLHACKMPIEVLLPCLKDVDLWSDFAELADMQPRYLKFLT